MKQLIIVHYSEIGLKKGNIDYFVEKLLKAIRVRLRMEFKDSFKIVRTLARILITLPDDFEKDKEKYVVVLSKIGGIKNFKFACISSTDVEKIGLEIWENMPKEILDETTKPKTFVVRVKRSMPLPLKSFEVEREIGAILLQNGLGIKVKMKDPELLIDVEFFNEHGYFSYKKYEGLGGFPPNSQSKLISLISAGFDSPVAAFRMMRRGARVIFAHFHGYPYTGKEEMEQVRDLVKILSVYQFDTKLYMLPFAQVQRAISTNMEIPGKLRTILYRRMMVKIAEAIARKEGALGLVTGDNYGQVASQTPENIFVIHEASVSPIYQPLIALDKEDIVRMSEQIGTHEISKLPCKDTCSMFAPAHPEIRASVKDLREYEKKLPVEEWIEKVLKEAELIKF